MKIARTLVVAAAALVGGAALAQPSLYYVWKNKTTGQTMCEPEADAKVWVKVSGPYEDPNCRLRVKE